MPGLFSFSGKISGGQQTLGSMVAVFMPKLNGLIRDRIPKLVYRLTFDLVYISKLLSEFLGLE